MSPNDTSGNPYQSPGAIQPSPFSPTFQAELVHDRSLGMMLFGVLEVVLGVLCALAVPLMAMSMFVAQNVNQAGAGTANVRMMIPMVAMYAVLAVIFVWLGIGSMQCQRWARAVTLVISWVWLIGGMFGMAFFVFFMRDMFAQINANGKMPPGAMLTLQLITGGMMGCIYIFMPGGLVLFYRSRHVKATCEARHPEPCWTDRCPLPVLALSLMLAWGALWLVGTLSYGAVTPFFGIFISGIPGGLMLLALSAVYAYLAWAIYRLRPHAWWLTMAATLTFCASAALTFSRHGVVEMYERMGMPPEQLAMMEKTGMISRMAYMPWFGCISGVAIVAYLLYIRKYFRAASEQPDAM
jgi:hypothetical protein